MQQIINFIIRNKSHLLFLSLFFISIIFTIQSHSYHKSKFINSANNVTGGVYNSINNLTQYLNLKSQNQILAKENKDLKSLLYNKRAPIDNQSIYKTSFGSKFKFYYAQVIRNSYNVKDNYILINQGKKNGIKQDFGVITNKGIVGIIDKTSKNYATVVSILNTTNRISAMLKKSKHYGSLTWNAKDPNIIQLTEVPKIAPVKKGDTIVTSGRSSIFPKNIPIGIVLDFKLDLSKNFYDINIKPFNDMTNLEHVYIIKNNHIKEINSLLNSNLNE